MKKDTSIIKKILHEAKAYSSIDEISKLVQSGTDLSAIPVQPLYMSLINLSNDVVAGVLPSLSVEQRQALRDLDLWHRDNVNIDSFEHWIDIYNRVQDEKTIEEFLVSEDFLLYLKSRVNIYTFDTEDPQYPDHDYYFLTDDSLLLIEYSDSYQYVSEIKSLIRVYYSLVGVENAYAQLFKLINDSFYTLQEDCYRLKKDRLRDYGFVDYFDALEQLIDFKSIKQLDNFIANKKVLNIKVDSIAKNQSLHSSALVSFDNEMESIIKELSKVQDADRKELLHFSFIRLVNATISLSDALRSSRIELTRLGKTTKMYLELGINYIHSKDNLETVFNKFDFIEVYKVGFTLINLFKKKLYRTISKSIFKDDRARSFIGSWWENFIIHTENVPPEVRAYGVGLHPVPLGKLSSYYFWKSQASLFCNLIPYISQFYESFKELSEQGKLQDSFYLNYTVDSIDFESILISSLVNNTLYPNKIDQSKLGISVKEFKQFLEVFFIYKNQEFILKDFDDENVRSAIDDFSKKYGFSELDDFDQYIYSITYEHLSGYDFDTLDENDFEHVGGPIILKAGNLN